MKPVSRDLVPGYFLAAAVVAAYLLGFAGRAIAPSLSRILGGDAAVLGLRGELWGAVWLIILVHAVPVGLALYWLISGLRSLLARRRLERQEPPELATAEERRAFYLSQAQGPRKKTDGVPHALLAVLCGLSIMALAYLLNQSGIPQDLEGYQADLALWEADTPAVYTGRLHSTERPIDPKYDYFINPDANYCYFTTEKGDLRCARAIYDGGLLMQPVYTVEYLPNTFTVLTVTDSQGNPRTGADYAPPPLPEGYWRYGDLDVRRCEEVYGYDSLSQEARQFFDLCYGDYLSGRVISGEESTHSFQLPQPLDKADYRTVNALYEALRVFEPYPNHRYDTNDGDPVSTVYAGGILYSDGAKNDYNHLTHQKAEEILAALPQGLEPQALFRTLCAYLSSTVAESGTAPPQPPQALPDGITVLTADLEADTAFGALVLGQAEEEGMVSALQLLACQAGLPVLPLTEGETLVELEDGWYYLTFSWSEGQPRWTLSSQGNGALGETGFPLPPALGTVYLGPLT